MKTLIKKTDTALFSYFKLFSVAFSTIAMVGVAQTLYKDTNIWIAGAIALPFAWFYAFNWIGAFEQRFKLLPILISGTIMMAFYTTWVPGIKSYYDSNALSVLKSNVDYQNLKEQHGRLGYDDAKYKALIAKYSNIEDTVASFESNKKEWIANKNEELLSVKYEANGKTKSLAYRSDVSTALNFRENNTELDLPGSLRTPMDVATILYEKELKELKEPGTVAALKEKAYKNSFAYLKAKRDELRAEYVVYENRALKNSYSETFILTMVLILGFVVEILLNALSLWRNLIVKEKEEKSEVNTLLTLLNKTLLMDRLKSLKVIHASGKDAGKVEAIYATMINIIVLYKERKKEAFVRYRDIKNRDICEFIYLDVYAERHIKSAFDLLQGKKVQSLSMDEIEEMIKTHKNS